MESSSEEFTHQKYIFVCGATASGIGKGITASSIAACLQAAGYRITLIKIDPYLNIDAGTMNPYEHGEVFVLDDGTETDLDLGNYERFLNINLTGLHNITQGKIYQKVLNDEREGKYLGKTVQIVPHLTDAIKKWVYETGKIPVDGSGKEPQFVIIELGGTVGDIESAVFLEAIRQFQSDVGKKHCAIALVSLLPIVAGDEQKTKPCQHGIKELRLAGFSADLILGRSKERIRASALEKIAMFGGVSKDCVFSLPDSRTILEVPLILNDQNIVNILGDILCINKIRAPDMTFWQEKYDNFLQIDKLQSEILIAFVGKYIENDDAYLSVKKAFDHCMLLSRIKLNIKMINAEFLVDPTSEDSKEVVQKHQEGWDLIKKADGIFVAGGFGVRGAEGKILAINYARVNKKPLLGVCFGFQLSVVEFCRNVLGWKTASTEEFKKELQEQKVEDPKFVIKFMPEIDPKYMGATLRRGAKQITIQ